MPAQAALPKFCDAATAAELVAELGTEFAVVRNPAYIYSPIELYPLAPKPQLPIPGLRAILCDMDGTITSTETLCLHSLETLVRRMTGRLTREQWEGLSPERDYPFVIGNSTTRHVEYLLDTYGSGLDLVAARAALLDSALWTILVGTDPQRQIEARDALGHAGLGAFEAQARREGWATGDDPVASLKARAQAALANTPLVGNGDAIAPRERVREAIEIYYARYHQILHEIEHGRADQIELDLAKGHSSRLIAPMPGLELFLAIARGLLAEDEVESIARHMLDRQHWHPRALKGAPDLAAPDRLARLRRRAAQFRAEPIKMAVVTSSIRHEAEIVLEQLFRELRGSVDAWPLPAERRAELTRAFAHPQHYYQAIITASDSSEIRLKPHRDLYALALHRLGIAPPDFTQVLGLEDSESGLIAIRAAGVGLSVAVPFADTMGHDMSAATKINFRGLWEVMLEDDWFLG